MLPLLSVLPVPFHQIVGSMTSQTHALYSHDLQHDLCAIHLFWTMLCLHPPLSVAFYPARAHQHPMWLSTSQGGVNIVSDHGNKLRVAWESITWLIHTANAWDYSWLYREGVEAGCGREVPRWRRLQARNAKMTIREKTLLIQDFSSHDVVIGIVIT